MTCWNVDADSEAGKCFNEMSARLPLELSISSLLLIVETSGSNSRKSGEKSGSWNWVSDLTRMMLSVLRKLYCWHASYVIQIENSTKVIVKLAIRSSLIEFLSDEKTLTFRYSLLSNLVAINSASDPFPKPTPRFLLDFQQLLRPRSGDLIEIGNYLCENRQFN